MFLDESIKVVPLGSHYGSWEEALKNAVPLDTVKAGDLLEIGFRAAIGEQKTEVYYVMYIWGLPP